jgi:glyoxylase-like metal-dependent hydrolase (beta-lactamase superfamily II)
MGSETFRFDVGSFACTAILDGTFRYPPGLFFANVPKEQYEPRLRQPGQDLETIEVPYNCLFIDTGRQRVLVDTGAAGFGPTTGKLHQRLRAAGIEPREIDTVVLSHGHPDHIGGNLNEDGTPAFPNARFVMFQEEWEYWMSNPSLEELPAAPWLKEIILASATKNLPPIRGQLDLLHEETKIVPGISAIAAPGHTPGHMALEIRSEGEQLLFVADAILHPLHIEHPETCAVVDHQPAEMVTTRRALLDRAKDTIVMASHFPFPGLGRVTQEGAEWRWQPIAATCESRS